MSAKTGIGVTGTTAAPRSATRPVASRGIIAALALTVLVCLLAATCGSRGLGLAADCGLILVGALALAVAVPSPSGGSRRRADVARLERLGADRVRRGAEPTRHNDTGARRRTEAVRPERPGAPASPTDRRAA